LNTDHSKKVWEESLPYLSVTDLLNQLSRAHSSNEYGSHDDLISSLEEGIKSRFVDHSDGHTFSVTVSGCTREQAEQVMRERIDHEEDYGFKYTIEWTE